MKAWTRLLAALILSLVGLSCSTTDPNALRVTSPLPAGTLPRNTEIALTFSRGVVPPESTNVWTTTPFLEFSPPLTGAFVWQDTSRLVFSPDGGFPGDARFQVKLNRALLLQLSGAPSFAGEETFAFSTETFTLRGAEFFYDRIGAQRVVGIKANLEFTYAVDPAEAAKALHITVDKEAITTARVLTTTPNRLIAVEVGPVTQTEKSRDVIVTVDEALVSTETGTHVKLERPLQFALPPLAEMKIYGHEFGSDGTAGWIRLRTSQEVDVASAKNFLVLDPERAFAVEGDGGTLTLRGAFEPGSSFHLVVKKGLESILGGRTQNDYEADVVIGNIAPSFGFASSSGVYMLLAGRRELALTTINLPRLYVRISQVYQNNLLFFLEQGRYYDYDWEDDGGDGTYTRKYRYNVGNFGRQIVEDTITTTAAINREVTTLLPLEPALHTGYKGFYVVEIADPEKRWRTTSKLISISNIGLIVKESAGEVLVFASSLENARPLPDVQVSLVSTTNQTMGTQKTDRDGVARFSNYREMKADFELKLVTAELDGDFNFINLPDYRVESSRFPVDGKRSSGSLYDAMLYGDRNIYRPGEKIILSGVVRELTQGVPAGIPVRVRLTNPRGTVLMEQQHTLNAGGSFETSYQTLPTAPSGTYRFELSTGNNLYLTDYQVSVEDFVPDRLRVSLTPSTESASPGDKITYALQAFNFFGPPAAGRSWELEATFQILPFVSKAFPDFRFRNDAATEYSADPHIVQGTTDNDGKATMEFPLPKELTSTGVLRARARAAVFDESGRPVYQIAQTTVYPTSYYIGVRQSGASYVAPNTAQKMRLIAVDRDDKPIDGFRANIAMVRREWHSVLRQHPGTGTLRYVSEKREVPVKSEVVTLGATPYEYTYTVPRSGEYVVRVGKEGEPGYNEFSFYSYSWGTTDITSFEVDPEARVDIVLDKKVYAPGEKAKVLFQAPFNGTMLVTVERNSVLSYRYLDVVNNAAAMELNVDEAFLPNVYITAVLFRPVTGQNIPLMAGHGFAPLLVEMPSNRLVVTVTAPERVRPKTRQTVTVNTGGEKEVYVTLAAVDEGICQVKNYKTPDPYGHFYAKKALETVTFDFFKHLIAESGKAPGSSSGGGDDAAAAKRVNPLGVQRFKPLALWSGILTSAADGTVRVPLDIPEFSGELRLMAFAYKGGRYGSAAQPMKVSDPVVLTPSLPRFLSPGDSVMMQVTAFNTTGKPAALTLNVETSGGVVAVTSTATLTVGPNQERFVRFPLRATGQVGKAVVRVHTTAFGEKLESVTEIPVRPGAPFAADAITGVIEAGTSASQTVADAYLPYERRAYLTLSQFPVGQFARQLKGLVGYPHGCLEQTVSKAFPQIYLRDIATVLAPEILQSGSPAYFVNEALTKVAALQNSDGSFAYWPDGGFTNEWTSVYATHFLLEAKRSGYAVNEGVLKSALLGLGTMARGRKTEDLYTYEQQKVVVRRIAARSTLYALFVLSLAGTPEKSMMNFYRTEKSLLTDDTRSLLAAAFALSGDRKAYGELLPAQFTPEETRRTTGESFDSPVRAAALMLYVMLETDPNNPEIPRVMEYLSRLYKTNGWFSTQDDAFTLLAFGKAARMASAATVEGTVKSGGKEHPYRGGTMKVDLSDFGGKVTTTLRGQGKVYYTLVTEGIRKDGKVKIEDRNLQVRREHLDRSGKAVDLRHVRQNSLIVVKLSVTAGVDLLENVAISDLLPAGFEIDNPRITETTTYPFTAQQTTPRSMDIRDDRINLYTGFAGGKRHQVFYYVVRAVTAGTFQYPPVVAEAMYDGQYYSASGQTTLVVTPP
jgi:alpha-2-macroglobulin